MSIPQVRQGSVRFNLREEEPPPSPFPFLLYLFYDESAVVAQLGERCIEVNLKASLNVKLFLSDI